MKLPSHFETVSRARIYACMRRRRAYLPLHMSKVKALAVIFVIQSAPPGQILSSFCWIHVFICLVFVQRGAKQLNRVVVQSEPICRALMRIHTAISAKKRVCARLNVHKVFEISSQNMSFRRPICMRRFRVFSGGEESPKGSRAANFFSTSGIQIFCLRSIR